MSNFSIKQRLGKRVIIWELPTPLGHFGVSIPLAGSVARPPPVASPVLGAAATCWTRPVLPHVVAAAALVGILAGSSARSVWCLI